MSSHAVIKLRLRAVIGDFNFDDVVMYTSAWALNTIPSASLLVAVGRNVNTQKLATIHNAVKTLTTQIKAQVYLTAIVKDVEQALPGVPNGEEIKIFDGRVVGTGWQRSQNGAHFTIHLLHWLGDLNYASSVSASLHPGSPGDMVYPAVFPAIGLTTVDPSDSPVPAWVPTLSTSLVNEGGFADIWSRILLPFLKSIASDDPYDRAWNGGSGGSANPDTLEALSKIGPNPDGTPLALDTHGATASTLADGMRTALISEMGGSWINTTLWGKIIGEWAPAYWFSVVPRVDDALIVPFTGGLRGEPWAVIGDEDYASADLNSQLHQILRAVGITWPVETATSFDLNLGLPQVARGGLMGYYQAQDSGMVLLKDAPKWLSHPSLAYPLSFFTEGIDRSAICTAVDEAGVGHGRNPARNIDTDIARNKGIASAYAEQWYVLESLKGRTGEVAGKLRFDIAPGSNVLVVAGGERHIPQANAVSEDIYATVTQVSYVINAEAQKAGTAFSLAHIRTTKENTAPGTSIAKPPLYEEAWSGAKLVPAAPGPEQHE